MKWNRVRSGTCKEHKHTKLGSQETNAREHRDVINNVATVPPFDRLHKLEG